MSEEKKRMGGAWAEAEQLRKEICSAESVLQEGRVFYYISPDGRDENDGRSPEKAVKSPWRLGTLPLRSGDVVLFQRGAVFRLEEAIGLRGGVGYGAYGAGAKPVLSGSVCNYAQERLWRSVDSCLWVTLLPYQEAGVVTFDGDTRAGVRKKEIAQLKEDGDYFHDIEEGIFYLYCEKGNPGSCYHDIEIGTTDDLLFAQNVNDVKIDNLCLKYASRFAVNFGNNKEIRVSNCEIAWIGGADFNDSIRYGNGVQFWYRGEDILVRRCWIYQVFDAALTFQGSGNDRAVFQNIVFEENLIEYCSMNIEFWAGEEQGPKPQIEGIRIRDNLIRFGGYGWGGLQRPDLGDQALLLAWGRHYEELSDFQITDNVFDCADCNLIWMLSPERQEGLIVQGNSYYQSAVSGRNPEVEVVRGSGRYAGCQEELEQAVGCFEKEPEKVMWLE